MSSWSEFWKQCEAESNRRTAEREKKRVINTFERIKRNRNMYKDGMPMGNRHVKPAPNPSMFTLMAGTIIAMTLFKALFRVYKGK